MRNILFTVTAFAIFSFQACDENPVGLPSKPLVNIIQPLNNSNIPDSITILVKASDDKKVIRLEIFIDHYMTKFFKESPYSYLWFTNNYPEGSQHIIEAYAYDEDGNVSKSKPVIVDVFRFMPSYLNAMLNSDTTIILQWNDNCSFETGFEVEQATNDSVFSKIAETDSNTTQFTVRGVFNRADKYYFRVRAKTNDSFSGYSNTALAYIVLPEPTDVSLEFISDTTAVLRWKDNSSFETSFIIQQNINFSYSTIMTVPTNSTTARISGLFYDNYFYEFRIGAVGEYPIFSVPVRQQYKFHPPQNLSISHISIDKLKIEWENGNNFETSFKIERSTNDSSFIEISTTNLGQLNFIDDNVDTSNEYSYKVKAFTRTNTSSSSIIVRAGYIPYLYLNRDIQAPSSIASYDINEESSLIAMGGYTQTGLANYLIDVNSGSLIKTLYPADSVDYQFYNIGISFDESVVAAGSFDNYVTLWNISDGKVKGRLYTGNSSGHLLFHHSKDFLITSAEGGDILVWDYLNESLPYKIDRSDYFVFSIAISNSGNYFAISCGSEDIKIYDIYSGSVVKTINSSPSNANLTFVGDDILLSSKINVLKVWNINLGLLRDYTFDYGYIYNLSLHPNKRYLAASCEGGIIIFDFLKEKIVKIFTNISGITGIRFIYNGQNLISYGIRDFSIWNFDFRWQQPIN